MPDILIWPAVAVVLGICALFILRAPLVRLIDRITKAGKEGISFDRAQERGEQQPPPLSFDEIMKQPISATALDREGSIQHQLQAFALRSDTEKVSVLTRALATTRIELEFNSLSHNIFGSQLGLLVQLSGTRMGLSKVQAETALEQAKTAYPTLHGEKTFDEWFRYLASNNLVSVQGDKIDITQYGTDFLKHLVDARMTYNRYG